MPVVARDGSIEENSTYTAHRESRAKEPGGQVVANRAKVAVLPFAKLLLALAEYGSHDARGGPLWRRVVSML